LWNSKGKGENAAVKITSEIFQVGGSGFTDSEDAAVYLVHLAGHAALVDAGCGRSQERLFRNISGCGIGPNAIEYLLITHCHYDHTGGIQGVRDRTKCTVVAHELEVPYLEDGNDEVSGAKWYGGSLTPSRIDLKITGDRQMIELGGREIQAIHAPGHSPGSVVYVMQSDGQKILFGQDVHGPLHPSLLSNREDYLRSLKLLISLQADILCEGHYGVIRGKDKVEDFIASFM
jgi:glyoxylase-like metal-dependent hydrolase (beta-lactamase superfamily II)